MTIGTRTKTLAERAERVMPGRQSNFRAVPGAKPLFLERAEGLHYFDADGKRYIDFILSMGPAIWGYGDAAYKDAIRRQLDRLPAISSGASQCALEVELAERIVEHVPCAEWVRFGISGSEAVQLAVRLARAYSGRPYVLRFFGHYHGWLDGVFGGVPGNVPGDGLGAAGGGSRGSDDHECAEGSDRGNGIRHGALERQPEITRDAQGSGDIEAQAVPSDLPVAVTSDADPYLSEGLAPGAIGNSLMIPWNDLTAFEATLQAHSDRIALVLMEPILCNYGCCPPRPGYLEGVRELCSKHGVLLCFDEVITGFRVALGGAQAALGVTPDLATFGKALAGGFPLSAVAGRADILQLLRDNRVLGPGTFNSFPPSLAAAIHTIDTLAANDGARYRVVEARQRQLSEGLAAICADHGRPCLLQGPLGVIYFDFVDKPAAYVPEDLAQHDAADFERFRALWGEEGVLMGGGGRIFISPNHTEEDMEQALAAADRAMVRAARGG